MLNINEKFIIFSVEFGSNSAENRVWGNGKQIIIHFITIKRKETKENYA